MKRLHLQRYLKLTIGAVFAISACQSNPDKASIEPAPTASVHQADCRTIQHQQGETEICGQPQRIVVLGPFVLEPLLALGIQPIAYADHGDWHQGDYDNPSQQIPYLGQYVTTPILNAGSAIQPSIETLLQLQPDLILGVDFNNAAQYEILSQIAPTVLLRWDDAETNVRAIAQATGYPERADALLGEIEQQVKTATDELASVVADFPNVLLLSSSQLQEINVGNSAHGLCSTLLADLGFNLVAPEGLKENRPGATVPVSMEILSQVENVDLILLLGSELDEVPNFKNFHERQVSGLKQAWQENLIAQSLDASKAGRVYFIPAYLCLGLPGVIGTELYLQELKGQLLQPQS
ncbi:MAG: iron-siderophore ABC transporter substrate-binding protein [Cyanobacteria bacterium P01_F01_bin.86]